ncbi:COP23 domain-containing protein [Crocosphaera sp. XPORK-15E]|uniref:COP23 domain-containing protein n=1 Tax=Crocosphaera sp. XPORK-15E TaxID=3110247 RepID=UPI002B1F26F2|nr:COP23 domain-containing protein [Crocosphaera sp. XPORK-15E]MEA5534400.1 COP23 domain-containing protein [Crocosphaera sp. XPORK-15E]
MKNLSLIKIPPLLLVIFASNIISPNPSNASTTKAKFFCAKLNQEWHTFVDTPRGKAALIKWESGAFQESGWTDTKRCQEVSKRFRNFAASGKLKEIVTGEVNNYPVLCPAQFRNGPCTKTGGKTDVLVTLKKDANPKLILRQLLDINKGIRTGNPLSFKIPNIDSPRNDGESSVNLDTLIRTLPVVDESQIEYLNWCITTDC